MAPQHGNGFSFLYSVSPHWKWFSSASRMSVHTDIWVKSVPGGAVQGSPSALQTWPSRVGWSTPYLLMWIFTKSHHFKYPCGPLSTFYKRLWKPVNFYNDINSISVNTNLLFSVLKAQPFTLQDCKRTTWQLWLPKHGDIYQKQQLLPFLPSGVLLCPSAAFKGACLPVGWQELGMVEAVVATLVCCCQQIPAGNGSTSLRVSTQTCTAGQDWLQAGQGRCWVGAAAFYGKSCGDHSHV